MNENEKSLLDEPINDPINEEYIDGLLYQDGDERVMEAMTIKGGFMNIKLMIYGSEVGCPHFHFYKGYSPEQYVPEEKRSGGGCICIDSPNYLIHHNHTDTMTEEEIEGLIEFLKSPHENIPSVTNWQYILATWESNNPELKEFPTDFPIPDYKHDMEIIKE